MNGRQERARAQREDYCTYVRLQWLLDELPHGHPSRPHLQAAAATADRHWRRAPAGPHPTTGEDLILDDGPLVRHLTSADLAWQGETARQGLSRQH